MISFDPSKEALRQVHKTREKGERKKRKKQETRKQEETQKKKLVVFVKRTIRN